jgi:hypothetical protein
MTHTVRILLLLLVVVVVVVVAVTVNYIKELQKIAILGTAHLLRKVLM